MKVQNCESNIDLVWFGMSGMQEWIGLEQTVLTVPQTCLQLIYLAIYRLSKLDLTDERTDERTNGRMDICTSRAAFAAENRQVFERHDLQKVEIITF